MENLKEKATIGHEISRVSFSFYSTSEIRRLSVKQITNPVLLDSLNHPNKGGLYDPALGPMDRNSLCATCSLPHHACPGHVGHIELAVPVYNPVLFLNMYQLIRATCFYCHHFKMATHRVHKYEAIFKLIDAGLLLDAMNLTPYLARLSSKKPKKGKGKKESESMVDTEAKEAKEDDEEEEDEDAYVDAEEYIARIDSFVKEAFSRKNSGGSLTGALEKDTHAQDYRRRLISEFFKKIPPKRCDNCKGLAATLRKDGSVKIFKMPLTHKSQAQMKAMGLEEAELFPGIEGHDEPAKKGTTKKDENDELEMEVEEDEDKEAATDGRKKQFLLPLQIREHLRLLWQEERDALDLLFGTILPAEGGKKFVRSSNYEQFFYEVLPVAPTRYRPASKLGDQIFENSQNTHLTAILNANIRILEIRQRKGGKEGVADLKEEDPQQLEKIVKNWIQLQEEVNQLVDSSTAPQSKGKAPPPGIKQLLERKEGLFRKHMMGKRVNFAARSVISPDPFIETTEIGIPMVFAKRLTYPEPVTAFNVKELRQAVVNGPNKHPGATHIQNEDGSLSSLNNFSLEGRVALSNQLMTPQSSGDGPLLNKKVLRHIRNGDVVIMNRQPTLHKPSMMAHIARILPGEKTLRLHYANCDTYNADFDGDEMNMHFPQNEIARAEAYMIANTNNQYLVPTDGSPLRGLIQDHVGAGVMLTKRDTFLTRDEYQQFLYSCLPDSMDIEQLPPTISKPKKLWTGKQVISTIMKNLTRGRPSLSMKGKAKIPQKAWRGKDCEESAVIFETGDLVCGVLDKNQFGASEFGLVHACYELYGPDLAGRFLTTLGKLFTRCVQTNGFTCRMDDLLLTHNGNGSRKDILSQAKELGHNVSSTFVGISPNAPKEELVSKLRKVIRDDKELAKLDNAMKTDTNKLTSAVLDSCLPHGLKRKFPANHMSLMTQSGAKGSNVNMSQITCLLGQQELEGRRVPVMVSGKTLPAFQPFDTSSRAGGYITQRFLTGIKPQEFFFHCMAGREGLVDTAVKTSRAGYLQRCIIKHLEGLRVNYDQTVRNFDGSIVQFHYGEDSLDVTKQPYLAKFDFVAQNFQGFLEKHNPRAATTAVDNEKAMRLHKKLQKNPDLDPILSQLNPGRYLGAVSETFSQKLEEYIQKNPDKLITDDEHEPGKSRKILDRKFRALLYLKYLRSLVEPGEVVGILAAQSIGEPSTQMTLNTFHFAGVGAKNVTLGIPRLREIIMTASANIKTPYMEISLVPTAVEADSLKLCQVLSKLTLSDIIDKVVVKQSLSKAGDDLSRGRVYNVSLKFMSKDDLRKRHKVNQDQVSAAVESIFLRRLLSFIAQRLKITKASSDEIGVGVSVSKFNEVMNSNNDDDENADKIPTRQEDEPEEDDGDATAEKIVKRKKQAASYEEDDSDKEEEKEEAEEKEGQENGSDNEEQEIEEMEVDEDTAQPSTSTSTSTTPKSTPAKNKKTTPAEPPKKTSPYERVSEFYFDKDTNTCHFTMKYPVNLTKLLMNSEIEKAANATVLREVRGINRCFIEKNENEEDKTLKLATEGVNIQGLWEHSDVIDVNNIRSNNVRAILDVYGVEAARSTIVNEIGKVFGVYGISVDMRHLFLIADYMTFEGGYKAFNRMGMESSPSPLQKMSFETTMAFLKNACLTGDADTLRSPSSRLVVGKPVMGGTGCFELLQPLA